MRDVNRGCLHQFAEDFRGGFHEALFTLFSQHFITTVAIAAGSALAPKFSLASPQDPALTPFAKHVKQAREGSGIRLVTRRRADPDWFVR
jgi:hypothetical protein